MSASDRDIPGPGLGAPSGSPGAAIDILDPTGLLTPGALANLRLEAAAALTHIPRPGEVRVRLIDDAEMADAHLKYSDIPGTTDVLTFDLSEGTTATGAPLDVDILVCIDEARRQAVHHQHAAEREALLYILHGVLHCLGHDDHADDAFDRMHAEEDRILRAIGIGPLFSPGTPTLRGGSGEVVRDPKPKVRPINYLSEAANAIKSDLPLYPLGFVGRDPYPDGERGLSVDAIVRRRNLPHIRMPGATYFVTWKCQPGEKLSPAEQSKTLDALVHFHGERATVYAANVMSNHAHWIVRPFRDVDIDDLTTSVKRFSAIAINKLRGMKGHLWDPECFDHIIRDGGFFRQFLAYVIDNPVEARVVNTPAEYEWTFVSSAAIGRSDDVSAQGATQGPATECRGTRTEALS